MNRRCAQPTKSMYDEVLHKVDNNILAIKIPKDRRRVQAVDGQAAESAPIIDATCFDKHGKIIKREKQHKDTIINHCSKTLVAKYL